jgi:hypothetical protein
MRGIVGRQFYEIGAQAQAGRFFMRRMNAMEPTKARTKNPIRDQTFPAVAHTKPGVMLGLCEQVIEGF